MIAQIWRCRTRADDAHDFTNLLQARAQAQLSASTACLGCYVLQRELANSEVESLVLTLYERRLLDAGVHDLTPWSPAISNEEARLLLPGGLAQTQYQVVIDPRRARLFADLRRRFPLRIAALR